MQPELEAVLGLGRQALARFGVEVEEIQNRADAVRKELCAPISAEDPASEEGDEHLAKLRRASQAIEVEWVRLPRRPDNGTRGGMLGRTNRDLRLRSETGSSVLAVVREDEVIPHPGADLQLESGDAVGVLGTPEQRAAFRALAQRPMQDEALA